MRSVLVSIVAIAGVLSATSSLQAFDITIDVAPSVVSLDSQGQVVTIHTDIGYSLVDAHSVELDGLPIQSWKADNRGNFVAKFNLDDVKEMIDVGTVTVTLTGDTKVGEGFTGNDTIKVINPRKK